MNGWLCLNNIDSQTNFLTSLRSYTMKKDTASVPKKNFLTRLLILISLVGFSYCAFAKDDISATQTAQIEKVANASKTNITVVRVTTTVKVSGHNKRTNKKVVKNVMKIMKQKKVKTWKKRRSTYKGKTKRTSRVLKKSYKKHNFPVLKKYPKLP